MNWVLGLRIYPRGGGEAITSIPSAQEGIRNIFGIGAAKGIASSQRVTLFTTKRRWVNP